jgi:hypothetical protein
MPYPTRAAEDDRQLPLAPLKYADGARQRCDGSNALTFGPLMPGGETRAALMVVSGFERGDASVPWSRTSPAGGRRAARDRGAAGRRSAGAAQARARPSPASREARA